VTAEASADSELFAGLRHDRADAVALWCNLVFRTTGEEQDEVVLRGGPEGGLHQMCDVVPFRRASSSLPDDDSTIVGGPPADSAEDGDDVAVGASFWLDWANKRGNITFEPA
jgi:hypothetical protein